MGYNDTMKAIKRDVENGNLVITIENGTVTYSGKTYKYKDFLKQEHRGTDFHFDRETKTWQMSESSMYNGDKMLIEEITGHEF